MRTNVEFKTSDGTTLRGWHYSPGSEVTLRSVELASEYEPGLYIPHVSPTPLLMIVDTADQLAPADLALAAYERALQPKSLVLLNGGHFGAYVEDFPASSGAARDWFAKYLGGT